MRGHIPFDRLRATRYATQCVALLPAGNHFMVLMCCYRTIQEKEMRNSNLQTSELWGVAKHMRMPTGFSEKYRLVFLHGDRPKLHVTTDTHRGGELPAGHVGALVGSLVVARPLVLRTLPVAELGRRLPPKRDMTQKQQMCLCRPVGLT
jgi:hypothetical protein